MTSSATGVGADSVRRVTAEQARTFDEALEAARDYRGDVTVELDDGTAVEGFLYDRSAGVDRKIRLLPKDGGPRVSIPERRVRAIAFTGKDAAAGKTWENWVKRYAEKRLAGEAASIESEKLD